MGRGERFRAYLQPAVLEKHDKRLGATVEWRHTRLEMYMNEKPNLMIPGAIVLAGVLVALAVLVTRGGDNNTAAVGNAVGQNPPEITLRPVQDSDHILGNPGADLVIIEYSDTECPFCKNFQNTMKQIIAEYGKDGKVAWVYRHFPLAQLHTKAAKEAEATECAAEIGGKQKFWDYINKIFEVTPSNDGLDLAILPKIAEELGINKKQFEECLSSGKFSAAVEASYQEALKAGGRGTPYSLILTKSGEKLPIDGAQPYASVKAIIESLLKAK